MAQQDHWTFYGYSIIAPLSLFLPLLLSSGVALLIGFVIEKKKLIKTKKYENICLTILILIERVLFMLSVYCLAALLIFAVSFNEIHTLFSYLVLIIIQAALFHAFRGDAAIEPIHSDDEENEEEEEKSENYEPIILEEDKLSIWEKIQSFLSIYPASVYNGMKKNSKSFIFVSFLLLLIKYEIIQKF